MKLKKRLALLLATTTLLMNMPIITMASSTNQIISKMEVMPVGGRFTDITTAPGLKIKFDDGFMEQEEEFYISLVNAKWDEESRLSMIQTLCDPKAQEAKLRDEYKMYNTYYTADGNGLSKPVISSVENLSAEIGTLLFYDESTLRVKLNKDVMDQDSEFYIPILATLKQGHAIISLRSHGADSTITEGDYHFAMANAHEGSVQITVKNTPQIAENGEIGHIVIREKFNQGLNTEKVEITLEVLNDQVSFGNLEHLVVEMLEGFKDKEVNVKANVLEDGKKIKIIIDSSRDIIPKDILGSIQLKGITVHTTSKVASEEDVQVKIEVADVVNNKQLICGSETLIVARLQEQKQEGLSNVQLDRLEVSHGSLTPVFMPDIYEYTVNVPNETKQITVTGTAQDKEAKVTLPIEKDLQVGRNKIEVVVEAQSGEIKVYTIIVNRAKAFTSNSSNSNSNSSSSSSSSSGESHSTSTNDSVLALQNTIQELTKKEKQEILNAVEQKVPYTSLENILTVENLKVLTNNQFTDKELEVLLMQPEMLKALGINMEVLNTRVTLNPMTEINFTDVKEEHWANQSIQKAAALGVVQGMPDGTFNPNEALKVSDTFTFLDRILLLNNITEMKLSRSTVEKYISNTDDWSFASTASIASKLTETTLLQIANLENGELSRALLAQVLYDITDGELPKVYQAKNFADTLESPYQEAINYCVQSGLLNGISEDKMAPEKALTRAELMTVLVRLNHCFE